MNVHVVYLVLLCSCRAIPHVFCGDTLKSNHHLYHCDKGILHTYYSTTPSPFYTSSVSGNSGIDVPCLQPSLSSPESAQSTEAFYELAALKDVPLSSCYSRSRLALWPG